MNYQDIAINHETDALKRNTAESTMRVCQICLSPIFELRKASYLEASAGLRVVVHDACLQSMVDALSQHQQAQRERETLIQSIKASVS